MEATDAIRVKMHSQFFPMATRQDGVRAIDRLTSMLQNHAGVTLDFENAAITPSFADECVGQLAKRMGFENFKSRIHIINVNDAEKQLIKHVVARRIMEVHDTGEDP